MTNTINTLFEMASQFKFRYPYTKGMITTEDLWDLKPADLDVVYKNLSKESKATDYDSLIATKSVNEAVKANELQNKIEIVKYIFNHKQQAAELARMAADKAAKKQRILEVLAQKQDTALQNMSEADLMKMLDDLA